MRAYQSAAIAAAIFAANAATAPLTPEIANELHPRLAIRDVNPNTAYCGIITEGSNWCVSSGPQAVKYLYYLTVGEPWADGEGCNYIMETLHHFVEYGSYFRTVNCASAQNDAATYLAFQTDARQSERVNNGLAKIYPMVEGGFHCGPDPTGPECP
ncbi:hypothetical protein LTR56_024826 [Elasticomyces elasticus]|nr:hypothetical protein LTR56_024826 [Elasticomyces elasticus]KAK3641981.1 hypothetical protein LTR22_016306 [Elasticomyces elasticus]KAK4910668.1 hypothetical protein LTR49_020703 [Elasticomyces elasticus]KAK5742104.1 hypothetical protein LTS12_024387 [Elasticomyces elasticus]